ncbi:MAG: hypothetical protein IPL47_04590 [Phyllobacteriaceae bacterium]|nr:hypothetical protein [Phyllobacteriaceae bacterium]
MDDDWQKYDLHEDDGDPLFGYRCAKCGLSGMVIGDPPHRMGDLSGRMACTKCGADLGTVRSLIIKDRLATGAKLKRRDEAAKSS